MSTPKMEAYQVYDVPTVEDAWMLPLLADRDKKEEINFLSPGGWREGDTGVYIPEFTEPGPDKNIAFSVGGRVYVEVYKTVRCVCGALYVTEEEVEAHS